MNIESILEKEIHPQPSYFLSQEPPFGGTFTMF